MIKLGMMRKQTEILNDQSQCLDGFTRLKGIAFKFKLTNIIDVESTYSVV